MKQSEIKKYIEKAIASKRTGISNLQDSDNPQVKPIISRYKGYMEALLDVRDLMNDNPVNIKIEIG